MHLSMLPSLLKMTQSGLLYTILVKNAKENKQKAPCIFCQYYPV